MSGPHKVVIELDETDARKIFEPVWLPSARSLVCFRPGTSTSTELTSTRNLTVVEGCPPTRVVFDQEIIAKLLPYPPAQKARLASGPLIRFVFVQFKHPFIGCYNPINGYHKKMIRGENIGIFGTATRTSTLMVIHMLGETHASEIAKILGRSLSRIQSALESLELTGLTIGTFEGNTRRVRVNPRFIAADELKALLNQLAIMDIPLQKHCLYCDVGHEDLEKKFEDHR